MPTFKIDGREIPFESGDTIIRAAHKAGIDIPHYCWHPGLSVAANCRMCLVEVAPPPGRPAMSLDILRWDVEKQHYVPAHKPKLQPACQMTCAPGMEVLSESSPNVAEARSAVQELLLLNHPVDCPICDQAGECRLQDYWLEHQRTGKRMKQELVHKSKAVSFGPTIVYDTDDSRSNASVTAFVSKCGTPVLLSASATEENTTCGTPESPNASTSAAP